MGLGCRAQCFQSHRVALRPSHSCSITPVRTVCKPSNGNPSQGFIHPSGRKSEVLDTLACNVDSGLPTTGQVAVLGCGRQAAKAERMIRNVSWGELCPEEGSMEH